MKRADSKGLAYSGEKYGGIDELSRRVHDARRDIDELKRRFPSGGLVQDGVIISSPSGKRFLLKVDDSGAISTTEVV